MSHAIRLSLITAGGIALCLLPAARSAWADSVGQPTCMPHEEIGEHLRLTYEEQKLGQGVSGDGNLVEMYMAEDGNFTLIKTTPDGMSCVVDFGEGWQPVEQLETAKLTAPDAPQF